ncbi:MAG TPA: hypothetical protein VJ904_04835, partial [Tichowtungia sp.]|nr:hypothetical protein [Tichowtungia sp.]
MDHFREIAAAFACPGTYLGEVPYGSGHINDTFRVCYDAGDRETHYIHQRVNHDIFRDVSKLMENIGRVTRHQRKKLEASGAGDLNRRVLTLIPTVDGRDFYRDSTGKYWRTYACIENAVGFDVIESTDQVCAAARAFGEVQCQPADLPERLHETIPGFHNTR